MLASIHKAVFQFNSKVRPFQPGVPTGSERDCVTVWLELSSHPQHLGFPVLVRCHHYIESGSRAKVCLCLQFSVSTCCVVIEQMSPIKIRYIMTLSYFPDVLPYYFFQNVKFCSRKIPLFLYVRLCHVLHHRLCIEVCGCMIPGLGPDSIIKMAPYQYRKSHCGDKTISRSFYLHNGISYTGNRTSLYWIGALLPNEKYEYELFIACSIVAEDQQTGDWTIKSV